ncbi:hypothetical protein Q0812_00315 [Brevundimonas sp. 2R-24]|uniref:Uncharacterized protein n=1 Tax=Peiella sedimenti TaxID=3061083 RepID=A0ABT8SJ90_9CAUL|nr:hypothetical protein [Caulobacteraceae bacterium XZ-24]
MGSQDALTRLGRAVTPARVTAALVVLCGLVLGGKAALGMTPQEWAWALTAVLASVAAAALVHARDTAA